jgi:hypothetical protein
MKSAESKAKFYISYISLLLFNDPFSPSTKLSFLRGKETDRIEYTLSLQLCFSLDNNTCVLLLLTIRKLNVRDILLNWYTL